jgi:hypothetical protein
MAHKIGAGRRVFEICFHTKRVLSVYAMHAPSSGEFCINITFIWSWHIFQTRISMPSCCCDARARCTRGVSLGHNERTQICELHYATAPQFLGQSGATDYKSKFRSSKEQAVHASAEDSRWYRSRMNAYTARAHVIINTQSLKQQTARVLAENSPDT